MEKELEIKRQEIIDILDRLNLEDEHDEIIISDKLIESFNELQPKERMRLLRNYKSALKSL